MALSTDVIAPPPQGTNRPVRFAVSMLVISCVLWGISFPTAQRATGMMESAAPLTLQGERLSLVVSSMFNGWRFLAAAAVYLLLTWRSQKQFTPSEVRGGIIVGSLVCGGVFLQLLGLRYTVPSVSAFLTSLAVVFAPAAQALVLRRRVGPQIWASVALAGFGSILLSWPSDASAGQAFIREAPFPLLGELLTIAAAIFFTGHILAVDRYGKNANTARLTLVVFTTAGLLSLIGALALGGSWYLTSGLALFSGLEFSLTFSFLVLGAGILAMHLMNRYQPVIAPAAATVVYCLEPVFATISSAIMGAETLGLATLLGGAIVLLAVLNVARVTR